MFGDILGSPAFRKIGSGSEMGHKSEDPASALMEAKERRSQELPAELRKEIPLPGLSLPLQLGFSVQTSTEPPSSGLRWGHEAQPQSGQGSSRCTL